MSVLIKGMEMPYGCANCPFVSGPVYESYGIANYFCKVDVEGARGNNVTTEVIALYEGATEAFPRFCPLVEAPPHGRLIDKDKLRRDLFVNFNGDRIPFYDCDNFPTTLTYRDLHSILSEQPTIIEAEGSKQ